MRHDNTQTTLRRLGGVALLAGALLAAPGCASAPAVAPAPADAAVTKLTAASARGVFPGGHEHFTGEATIGMLFVPNGPRDFSGAYVTFQPGARTAWHSHPAGQTPVVIGEENTRFSPGERTDLDPARP